MDFLNKAKEQVSSSGTAGNSNTAQQPAAGGNTTSTNQNEDYGDKGLDFIEKKSGHTLGRGTNEKITDGARGLYEKGTGKQVDPKYSN